MPGPAGLPKSVQMITTNRLVFLHLHKSGGTFVNECLLRFVPEARQIGYHLPRRLIPTEAGGLPVVGFVRNPWSYYVSWYSFQRQQGNPNFLYRILSDDGERNFDATIRNMMDLGAGSIRLDLILRALPTSYSNQGLNLPAFALAPIRNTQLGFYSYLYRYLYGGNGDPVRLGRMEQLRDELPALLQSVGETPSVEMNEFIVAAAPRNISRHVDYCHYYSDSLRDLVAERDAEVIARHGYKFDDGTA